MLRYPKAYTALPVVAALPAGQPLDLKEAPELVSQLDLSWLPFAAKTYNISPNLADYEVVNMPLCPSDLPNRNGISFPISELVRYQPPPIARQVYRAWAGSPVHEEHDNEDCTKAVGVIFDTSLRQIRKYGDGRHWAVMGLIGIDRVKRDDLAAKVRAGTLNTGSMGAMADSFTCSVCGAPATDNSFTNCPHITSTSKVNWNIIEHQGVQKIAYLNAHGLSPIEYSLVADPAWATCLSEVILTR